MKQIDAALIISLGITPPQKEEEPTEDIDSAPGSDPADREHNIKLEAERDVYKRMYEQLLEIVTKGGDKG